MTRRAKKPPLILTGEFRERDGRLMRWEWHGFAAHVEKTVARAVAAFLTRAPR